MFNDTLNYSYISNDSIEINFGENLLNEFIPVESSKFFPRLKASRMRVADEFGIVFPLVRIRDNSSLAPNKYIIKIHGHVAGDFKFLKNRLFCFPKNTNDFENNIQCEKFIEPVFNLKCFWIKEKDKKKAVEHGGKIHDKSTVIITHLIELIKRNFNYIISYDDIECLFSQISNDIPVLVNELNEKGITISHIKYIICNLLSKGIPVYGLKRIFEVINNEWKVEDGLSAISEKVTATIQSERKSISILNLTQG